MKTQPVFRFFALILAAVFLLPAAHPIAALTRPVVYYHGRRNQKTVALTFDDGPHPRYTEEILAVLAAYDVHATFFFIGMNVESHPEIARRVCLAGHEIGNHTYSHPVMKQTDPATVEAEINRTDALLRDIGCEAVELFRPPQGLFDEELPALLRRISKKAILWNIDTRDWEHPSSGDILTNIESNLRGGDIILFHDFVSGESSTVPAIKKLIPALLERGYRFVTVSELIGEGKTPASR